MRKIISLIFILSSLAVNAQDNIIYEATHKQLKIGKYEYELAYEYNYQSEGKLNSYSEILLKDKKKQYIGQFIYQLKSSTEMRVSSHNPPAIQLENRIVQSYDSFYNEEKEQIIVTTNYYDEKEPKEKEIKTLQQGKKGFFYLKEKETYYKNGEKKIEKDLPQKIEFYKIPF